MDSDYHRTHPFKRFDGRHGFQATILSRYLRFDAWELQACLRV